MLLPDRAAARAKDRIAQGIDSSAPEEVRGNVHPLAKKRFDRGRVSPATVLPRMVMTFNRTAEQQADLERLLEEQQDPSSTNYHRWLTPEQFGERFGLSHADLAQVTEWLRARGFDIVETPPARTYVAFSGTVGQIDTAFRTEIHHYNVEDEEHFANASDPVLPGALASVVIGIHGLNDFKPRPHGVNVQPRLTSWFSGNHFLVPDDLATIYDIHALRDMGIDGTGQQIAVVGQTDITLSHIQAFRRNAGMVASDPQVILVPGSADPGVRKGDLVEADLDIEWAGAVAPGATIVYVNSGNGAFDSLLYAINNNVAPVISVSYGECETRASAGFLDTLSTAGQQANAQGQTITVASGDTGAADCDTGPVASQGLMVDIPASLPYVTGVGGTRFDDSNGTFWNPCCAGLTKGANNIFSGSALSYIPEIAWNDAGSQGSSGGGVSLVFPKPSWQAGSGVPGDGKRDVPDVAFAASPAHVAYLICTEIFDSTGTDRGPSCVDGFRDGTGNAAQPGSFYPIGGTSAGAPVMAGVVALLNQMTGTTQGNINPRLYQLAAISTDVYHDITSGNNQVSCRTIPPSANCPSSGIMGYSAGPGYDLVTGLGSVDIFNLAMEWVNVSIAPNPIRFGNVLPNIAKSVHVTVRNNNGGSLNITGISISGNFTQSNDCPGTLSFGATCTINVTLPPTAASTPAGTLTISASDSANPHQIPISGTVGDLAMQIAGPSRPIRSEANAAPATGSARTGAPSQTSSSTSGATAVVVTTVAAGTLNVAISPVRWTTEGQGSIRVTNRQGAPITIEVGVVGDITQESDCGDRLDAGAKCEIKLARKHADSSGELRIVTPSGCHSVRVGGE